MLVHTGQNYDYELNQVLAEVQPEAMLVLGDTNSSLAVIVISARRMNDPRPWKRRGVVRAFEEASGRHFANAARESEKGCSKRKCSQFEGFAIVVIASAAGTDSIFLRLASRSTWLLPTHPSIWGFAAWTPPLGT